MFHSVASSDSVNYSVFRFILRFRDMHARPKDGSERVEFDGDEFCRDGGGCHEQTIPQVRRVWRSERSLTV